MIATTLLITLLFRVSTLPEWQADSIPVLIPFSRKNSRVSKHRVSAQSGRNPKNKYNVDLTLSISRLYLRHTGDERQIETLRRRNKTMATATKYESRISTQDNEFYALVVRIDKDGQENVLHGFSGFYKTRATAERYAAKFIAKQMAR